MRRSIRRVAILGHTERPGVRRAAARLRSRLERSGIQVRIESTLAEHLGIPPVPLSALARWCQVMISLGGDGTVLTAGRAMAGKRGTLLPINLGGLGDIAAFSFQVPMSRVTPGEYISQVNVIDQLGQKFAFPRNSLVVLP